MEDCRDTLEMEKEFQSCINTQRFWMSFKVFMRIWDIMEQLSPELGTVRVVSDIDPCTDPTRQSPVQENLKSDPT